MSQQSKTENLWNVKLALAEKYMRLAHVRRSKPWRKRLIRQAKSYRQQAANFAAKLKRLTVQH